MRGVVVKLLRRRAGMASVDPKVRYRLYKRMKAAWHLLSRKERTKEISGMKRMKLG